MSSNSNRNPDDKSQPFTFQRHILEGINEETQAAGCLINPIWDVGSGNVILPSQWDYPDRVSVKQLVAKLRDSFATPIAVDTEKGSKHEMNWETADNSQLNVSIPKSPSGNSHEKQLPVPSSKSKQSYHPGGTYSDYCRCNMDEFLRFVRHPYNKDSSPGIGSLARFSCKCCWRANQLSILHGSVTPPSSTHYDPPRVATKCEKFRSTNRVHFSDKLVTLKFDSLKGNVFDYEEAPVDLSGVHKEVGRRRTGRKNVSSDENGEEDSSEEDDETDDPSEDDEDRGASVEQTIL